MAEPATGEAGATVTVSRRTGLSRRLVRQVPGGGTGTLPPAVDGVDRHELAPGEILLVSGGAGLPEPGYDPATGVLVVDSSAAQAAFRIAGPDARALVAKGAAIDLGDAAFPAAASATCRFGAYRVLLHRTGPDGYDMHADRSLEAGLKAYLLELGAEFRVAEG